MGYQILEARRTKQAYTQTRAAQPEYSPLSCSFQNRTKTGFVVFKSGQRVSKTGLGIGAHLGRLVNRRMGWVLDLGW